MFKQVATSLAAEHEDQLKGLSLEERLNVMKELLGEEGFVVEWEKKDQHYLIHEITCPYLHVGHVHPEVCTVDQTLISKMLAVPANKVQCILNGAVHCTYMVNTSAEKL
jgi:DeoR family suf operon transcriptional repressor